MSRTSQQVSKLTQQLIIWGLATILIVMPFHAFLSIYLGSIGFNQAIVQSWKEVLVLVLGFCWLMLCLTKRKLQFKFDPTNFLFLAIIVLSLLTTLLVRPNAEAVLFGVKTNLVALAVFFIAQVPIPDKNRLKKYLPWIIIIPGIVVAVVAILQSMVLPVSLLNSLGYSSINIDPQQIIDGSVPFHRAFSTLGGPNQLGTYLILPLIFSLVVAIKQKKYWVLLFSAIILVGIVLSFSRSAWLGAIVAIFVTLMLLVNIKGRVVVVSLTIALGVIIIITAPVLIRNNPRLENVVFHGRIFENRIEGSDQSRLEAISDTVEEVSRQPFGHGLGSAGPASFQSSEPVIPENWYLQIAHEIGLIGLALYILAFAALLGDFLRNRKDLLATGLFAVTCGVLVSNLFLHAWADSTLVLIMFTLYGLNKGQRR